MNKIRLSRAKFSHVVWENIFEYADTEMEVQQLLADRASAYAKLRNGADYNTGSVSVDAMYTLFCIAHFFKPKVIAEVGTFIGNSTFALAEGAGDNCEIHTCDYSNEIELESSIGAIQYPKAPSTDMFNKMVQANKKVNLMFFDGRLTPGDIALISKLVTDDTVYVFDDFEGIEKGVMNVGMFMSYPNIKVAYHLIYPPRHLNCNIAMLILRKHVEWTDQ
jgi:hypothetical protein